MFQAIQAQAHYRLIVSLFKVGIATALELEHSNLHYLKRAFEQALLEVLHESTRHEQAILLDVSKKTVQNMAARTTAVPEPSKLHALLQELEQRTLSQSELEDRLPSTLEFDLPALAIQMLTREGTIRSENTGRYTLKGALVGLLPEDGTLGTQAEQLQLQIRIMVRLAQGACTQNDLEKELRQPPTKGPARSTPLSAALQTLSKQGMIRVREGSSEDTPVWLQVQGAHTLMHPHPSVRHLTGLIDMATLMQDALKATLLAQDRDDFGQRNFRFMALPADVTEFVERHRKEVRAALERLEARAEATPERSRSYGFFWLLSEIAGQK